MAKKSEAGDPRANKRGLDPKTYGFLGQEFLTWLWFRCEIDGGTFPLEDGEVGVLFNEYVSLLAQGEGREQSIVKRDSAHRSREARAALKTGKLVSAARLEVARENRSYTVTVGAEGLDLRAVRYPTPEAEEPDERDQERLEAMVEVGAIVEGLYGLFLAVRTSDAWNAHEVAAMRAWIEGGRPRG